MIGLRTHLELGRVSNLPTVWSNALAAALLAGVPLDVLPTLATFAALSLFYVAGMYYNDACDAAIDAVERPARPIPSGRAGRDEVARWAFGLFGGGAAALAVARVTAPGAAGSNSVGWLVSGALLVGAIVLYDRAHKGVPHAPLVMGLCRLLVYVVAAYTLAGALPADVLGGGVLVFAWVVGLTLVARAEGAGRVRGRLPLALLALPVIVGVADLARAPQAALPLAALAAAMALAARRFRRGGPGDVGRAVGLLIAAICLVDAVLVARAAGLGWSLVAMLGFVATLALQRRVAGT